MHGVLAAEPAIFFQFQARRRVLFIFLRGIVATFAIITRHRHDETIFFFSHARSVLLVIRYSSRVASPCIFRVTGDREQTANNR